MAEELDDTKGYIEPWEEATIANSIMFRLVMEKPGLCKKLIERLLIYVNGGPPSDEFTNELDRTIKEYKQTEERRSVYMTFAQELLSAEANGVDKGMAKGKIKTIKEQIKAGLLTFATVKASGLYTEKELAAIAAT